MMEEYNSTENFNKKPNASLWIEFGLIYTIEIVIDFVIYNFLGL